MNFKMSNKVYDALRWVDTVVLPAALTFFGVISTSIGISPDATSAVMAIGAGLITFLGTILGISNNSYKIEQMSEDANAKNS